MWSNIVIWHCMMLRMGSRSVLYHNFEFPQFFFLNQHFYFFEDRWVWYLFVNLHFAVHLPFWHFQFLLIQEGIESVKMANELRSVNLRKGIILINPKKIENVDKKKNCGNSKSWYRTLPEPILNIIQCHITILLHISKTEISGNFQKSKFHCDFTYNFESLVSCILYET